MKRLFVFILTGFFSTIICWSINFFVDYLGIILLPIMFMLLISGLSGLVLIPIGVSRIIKKKNISNPLNSFIGLSIGFYMGFLIQFPLDKWNENNMNDSGRIIIEEIEKYKSINGNYPIGLSKLDTETINEKLPINYYVERFTYSIYNGEIELSLPANIFDRMLWDNKNKRFEYDDF